jgi:DNA mismatch endonuclease, patch repair protein
MTDKVSKEKRSEIMSLVRSKNTSPEKMVRKILHEKGFRFRLYRNDLPGTPDIVLPKHRKIVFVHGCYWHGHKGCPRAKLPTTNEEYWEKKIRNNKLRHKKAEKKLKKDGWQIIVIWECELKNIEKASKKLIKFMKS